MGANVDKNSAQPVAHGRISPDTHDNWYPVSHRGFDRLAPVYDRLAWLVFGEAIRQAQRHTISFVPDGANILIIGGGTGWYARELLQQKPGCTIVYVEASARMIALARQQTLPYVNRITFRVGTETSIAAGEQFEVMVTHFLLDLFAPQPLDQLMQRLVSALRIDGIWLFSDFQVNPTDTSWWKSGLLRAMYWVFRRTCGISARQLPDWEPVLSKHNLIHLYQATFFRNFITSRVYRLATKD